MVQVCSSNSIIVAGSKGVVGLNLIYQLTKNEFVGNIFVLSRRGLPVQHENLTLSVEI